MFKHPPLMAYRRDKNVGDVLVHTKLRTATDTFGTTPCHHPKCRICSHVHTSTTITIPHSYFYIKTHFTCTSSCLIYYISCTKCHLYYIGETSRQLNARFGERLRDAYRKVNLQKSSKDDQVATVSSLILTKIISQHENH